MAKRKQHRHPSKTTARERRRRWTENTPEEQAVRELNRLVRKHHRSAPDEDGDLVGVLRAAAEFALPQLLADFELGDEHSVPFEHWLMWKFGQVLHDPDVDAYKRWRAESSAKVLSTNEVN